MQDAVRPTEQAARSMYARGYQTWYRLSESASEESHLQRDSLRRLPTAFPNHPHFPTNVAVDELFRNTALVKAITTWLPTQDPGHLPPFTEEAVFNIAWDKPTKVILTPDTRCSMATLPDIFGEKSVHIPVLLQTWAYILSARWVELMPGAQISLRETQQSDGGLHRPNPSSDNQAVSTIHIGAASEEATRWWTAILSVHSGWDATIRNNKGDLLHSPWSTTLTSERSFQILAQIKTTMAASDTVPNSATAAWGYLADYCINHGISEDLNLAALAAALLIPAVKYDGRSIGLPIPNIIWDEHRLKDKSPVPSSFVTIDQPQLDKLLTLSCNARATKALLTSVFFEPGVESNICGMWLRGSFAFLNTITNPHLLMRTLIQRDPEIGFLWIGAFITGTSDKAFREGRAGWWKVDLGAAAWTGTLMSFVQEQVPHPKAGATSISRADECRLLFLCHGMDYTTPPLFPFQPFGSTNLEDTNLEVHEHSLCEQDHTLSYVGLTWHCNDGKQVMQRPKVPLVAMR
ncbi:uncharacterized protein FIESC28_07718 [Fusarium coffeatum]|uniref:Uncharacterized protein n=1 Tax=Fusarium coffeatum TaxID=231269 RepID=A0A366RCA5_9HYPO|nr:uncharacterized protein FIESC28_07718 [Fusarium coffeatum]RBR14482.1 hypothetical protein FIESC28_07718 [Fusarium coffeatum]